jgi:hypothetical protein
MNETQDLIVRFQWGKREFPEVKMRDGTRFTFETDGDVGYPLIELDWDRGALIIRPRCLMINATPESLRRYADILETK